MNEITVDKLNIVRGGRQLFSDFSISFEREKITALIAPSGAGKTSFLDIIAGLLPCESKTGAKKIQFAGNSISYMFQEDRLLPWCSVYKNILLPLIPLSSQSLFSKKGALFSREVAEKRAWYYVEKCGLTDKAQRLPAMLSGGERQRAALARAFAFVAEVLFMDEAFRSLDLHIKFRLMSLFSALCAQEKRTVIFVSHDIREVLCLAHRLIVLTGSPLSVQLDAPNNPVSSAADLSSAVKDAYTRPSVEHAALESEVLKLLAAQ